ncbi:MAG: transporter [Alphaproteobacteria bacterium]|nr:transporter [Alphaproteobacteria bacterium]
MKKLYLMTALAAILSAHNANAAGYQLNEFSAAGLGRSFAGIGVVGDDFSALGYNPAGMTAQKRSGVQLGLALTEIAAKAKSEQGTDKMDYFVPLPSAMGQYNLNNKWFFGLGVYVPYGLSTKYKHDSHVAQHEPVGVRKSELEVVDANFSTAYRFDIGLSLGASAILRYIKGQLTSNINNMPLEQAGGLPANGSSDYRVKGWSQSWQLGAMYEFDENTRVGLAYRFKSTQHTHGKEYVYMEVNTPIGTKDIFGRYETMADPELPASWILSGYHKWNDKWASEATVKYIQWHRFYEFPAHSYAGDHSVEYRWKDSWTFALGQEYYANENWTFRVGTAWDQAPTANNNFRTNRIPDSDRIWLSAGTSYTTGNHQIDLGYAFLTMMHGRVRDHYQGGDLDAKYHNHSNMFALSYQYKF